jgi:hypothetical protein
VIRLLSLRAHARKIALAGFLVVGFLSVTLSATKAQAVGKKTAEAIVVNRTTATTLRLDANASSIYSRFFGNSFGNWFNTGHFANAPMRKIAPGLVTRLKLRGYASEGLISAIVYSDVSNPGQTLTVSTHMHEAPHGNWIKAWGVSPGGFVVDSSDLVYNPDHVSGVFCVYDPGTVVSRPCDKTH